MNSPIGAGSAFCSSPAIPNTDYTVVSPRMSDSLGWDSGLDLVFNSSGDFNVLEQWFSNANEHQNHMEGLSKHRLLTALPPEEVLV